MLENVEDEFLGRMRYAVVHRSSGRVFLNSRQRDQVLELAVLRFKDRRLPVGLCLQLIHKNYVGFPPVIKVIRFTSLFKHLLGVFILFRSVVCLRCL